MKLKTTLFILAALFLSASNLAQAATQIFSYADPSSQLKGSGYGQVCHLDLAIKLVDYDGYAVKGIRVPVPKNTNLTNFKVWLSTVLETEGTNENKVMKTPDIVCVDATPGSQVIGQIRNIGDAVYLDVDFDQEYTVPEGGLYAGYSFDVTAVTNMGSKYPIVIVEESHPHSAYMRMDGSLLGDWNDWSGDKSDTPTSLCVGVKLEGNFTENACELTKLSQAYATAGKSGSLNVLLTNKGASQISNVGYTYTLQGKSTSGKYTFDTPMSGQMGVQGSFEIPLPAISELGDYPVSVTIDKVNGMANDIEGNSAESTYSILTKVPRHQAVFEEFSGTWCQWCPAGHVAMEHLAEEVPESIIISYHGGDVMTMKAGLPVAVSEFPYGLLDRSHKTEVYYGDYTYDLGIIDTYKDVCKEFTPAEISVSAAWADEEKTEIQLSSTTTFFMPGVSGADYRVGYVLLHDGMEGTDSKWFQKNGYSAYAPAADRKGMEDFVNGPDPMIGLTYNNIAIYQAGKYGLVNSLPSTIVSNKAMSHSTSIKLEDCVNLDGEYMVQDKDKLRAVALVYKMEAGQVYILNAAVCNVPGHSDNAPVKRVLMEEFTATTCGNCVRGAAAIELLNEKKPDSFIGVSYHCGDVMDISGNPRFVTEYPNAVVNRAEMVDPYFGRTVAYSEGLGIEKVIDEYEALPAQADIELTAYWADEERTAINIASTTTFLEKLYGDMRIHYMVVADGLTGSSADWVQQNGASGMPVYENLPGMKKYYDLDRNIYDMVYNDVVVYSTGKHGIEGSLPSAPAQFAEKQHSLTVKLSDCVSTKGENLAHDKDKLRVVAAILKAGGTFTTQVLNCNVAPVTTDPMASVAEIESSVVPVATEYYSLTGQRVASPAKGIFIELTRLSNGASRSRKIMLK